MASTKTEDIALRLWKLKGSNVNDLGVDATMKERSFNDLSSNSSDDDDESTTGPNDFRHDGDFHRHASESGDEVKKEKTANLSHDDMEKKNEEMKPTQSYIALIATAILKSKEKRLVLSDIYKYIMDNFSYFQSQDKSWRNSIRHNLSLNECFIKVGRSEQGKGHYWAIHPANYEDFSQGDFRRRRARRRVRRSFLDTHPYTGYPLRPYSNISRPRYLHDYANSYRPHFELRRQIHPISFYESYSHHQPRKFEPIISKRLNSHYDNPDILKKEKNAIITTLFSESTQKKSLPSRKVSSFSIDSILGNKVNEKNHDNRNSTLHKVPHCTDKHCNCHRSRDSSEHYIPYLYKNISNTKISPEANNIKRFVY